MGSDGRRGEAGPEGGEGAEGSGLAVGRKGEKAGGRDNGLHVSVIGG